MTPSASPKCARCGHSELQHCSPKGVPGFAFYPPVGEDTFCYCQCPAFVAPASPREGGPLTAPERECEACKGPACWGANCGCLEKCRCDGHDALLSAQEREIGELKAALEEFLRGDAGKSHHACPYIKPCVGCEFENAVRALLARVGGK
jgi:hypothetical protein